MYNISAKYDEFFHVKNHFYFISLFLPKCLSIMFKKIKNKALRIVLSVLTSILGLLLFVFLVFYLAVPSYTYTVPGPFNGPYWHNPYEGMNPDHWKKYNMHCHSRKYFGLTNGRLSTEENIDSVYQRMQYDHYGISDYMHINRHGSERKDFIPCYEHGYGLFRKTHQICIGAQKVWMIDYPFVQTLDMKQHAINQMGKRCRFVMPAHASFTGGYKVSDMKYLSNYRLLEVLNPFGFSFEHWDMALSNGHRVYIAGDDDSHNVLNTNEIGRCFTMINVDDMDPENVYSALESGMAYGVKFNPYYNQPFEMKVDRMGQLPHLTRCELVGDTLIVETSSDLIESVAFVGQGGKILKEEHNVKTAHYVVQPDDNYVRTELMLPKMHYFYLNPITRHQTKTPIDRPCVSVNYARTALLWIGYAFMVGYIIYLVIRKLIHPKTENHED